MKMLHSFRAKVVALGASALLATGIILPTAQTAVPKAKADTYTTNGLGYSTNVIMQDVGEFNSSSPILDPDFLNSTEVNFVKTPLNDIITDSKTYNSYSRIASDLTNKYKTSIRGGISYNAFTAGAYTYFENSVNTAKTTLTSQYYEMKTEGKKIYSLHLENSASFVAAYSQHFNPLYLDALARLKTNSSQSAYNAFFSTYGTHVVTGGVYGGDFKAYYGVYSDSEVFTQEIVDKLDAGIDAAYAKKATTSANIEYSISDVTGLTKGKTYTISRCHVRGGSVSYQNNLNEGKGYYNLWRNSLTESNAVLIEYTYNGLIPLWDALPAEYSSLANTMRLRFNAYASAHQETETKNLKEVKYLTQNTFETEEKMVREEKRVFTDSSRWDKKNKPDNIDLKELFGLGDIQMLRSYGFQYLQITLSFTATRIDDADYRIVFFYANDSQDGDINPVLHEEHLYNISKGGTPVTITVNKKDSGGALMITDLPQSTLTIAYRATGAWDDDWSNENVKLKLKFSKTPLA